MNKTAQMAFIEYRNWFLGFAMGALAMLLFVILVAKGIIPIDLPFLYS